MNPQKGDLIYVPAQVILLTLNKDVDIDKIDPRKAYIGSTPIKFLKRDRPINLIVLENEVKDTYIRVWYQGEEWLLKKDDAKYKG